MSIFSAAELAYLAEGNKLGRLATVDPDGTPHVVPLGWNYNPEHDTIDIGGRDFAGTRKFRNVLANPAVGFVVDDVLPPWRARGVEVRGAGGAEAGPGFAGELIRIWLERIVGRGIDSDAYRPNTRSVAR